MGRIKEFPKLYVIFYAIGLVLLPPLHIGKKSVFFAEVGLLLLLVLLFAGYWLPCWREAV
jgi:hypothetical protein